jgi:hypothetical protein
MTAPVLPGFASRAARIGSSGSAYGSAATCAAVSATLYRRTSSI